HPSSVTKMVQKLDRDGYLDYDKYRGFILTKKGNKIGKRLVERHDLLEEFLELIGVDDENIYDDVEVIEHDLTSNYIDRMTDLITYFRVDESRIDDLKKIHEDSDTPPK